MLCGSTERCKRNLKFFALYFFAFAMGMVLLVPLKKASAAYFELGTKAKRTGKVVKEDATEGNSVVSVVENDDFRITLKTDKAVYHAGDGVSLSAEVEYIGSEKKIELTCCDPVLSFKIEGSNGVKLESYVYYDKNKLVTETFKKGKKYEKQFFISQSLSTSYGFGDILDEEQRKNYEDYTVFYLPKGTYTFTAALTNELAKKKLASFYAELHLNIDVEGEIFNSGANLYRTLGKNEAVLIGSRADNHIRNMWALNDFKEFALEIPEYVEYNGKKYKVTVIGDDGVKYLDYVDDYCYDYVYHGVFSGRSFTSVKIPSTVKKISESAFYGCSLTSIDINAGELEIGDRAFSNTGEWSIDESLLKIYGGSVKTGKYAFDGGYFREIDLSGCKRLEIGEQAFGGQYALKKITLPKNTVSIGKMAFYDTGDKKDKLTLTIPAATEQIEGPIANRMKIKVAKGNKNYVSRYGLLMTSDLKTVLGVSNYKLSELVVPESVENIVPYAFSRIYARKLTLPDSVTEIPEGMVKSSTRLRWVTLGKNVTSIGDYAFSSTKIKKVALYNGLKSIGKGAFQYSKLTKKVSIPATVESIGNRAFAGCGAEIAFKKDNALYDQAGQILYEKGTKTVAGLIYSNTYDEQYEKLDLQFVLKGNIYEMNIPESVKEIDISSFASEFMGEYYSGPKMVVYEGAAIIFNGKEPPKFVDNRNSDKQFCIWVFLPDDADRDAYVNAFKAAGLVEGTNFRISDVPYEEW